MAASDVQTLTTDMAAVDVGASAFPCLAPMLVMRFTTFREQDGLVRSDRAAELRLLEECDDETLTVIFLSHSWWERPDDGASAAPDFREGERKNLKWRVACQGVAMLIDQEGLDESKDIADYGQRGWCRVEYFIFSLFSEMRRHEGGVRLFAVGSAAVLQRFKVVEFLGGDRGDMPSQGDFSFEADRQAITQLEDQMISAFGHDAIRAACAGSPLTVDLGAKMLRDEHLATLSEVIASGGLASTRTLSFNACPMITTLPPLEALPALRTLSLINCVSLRSLPDLSRLTSLSCIKLEKCDLLSSLPPLPPSVDLEELGFHLPEHLRADAPPDD